MSQNWQVEVRINGESVLIISEGSVSGVDNIIDYDAEIRECANNLLGFIGQEAIGLKNNFWLDA